MIPISYDIMVIVISCVWILVRAFVVIKQKSVHWMRELQLLLVYIAIVVVVRFTFCPFAKVDGKIQPLLLDPANVLPFRINWIPFLHLLDYPEKREILLNIIGNTTMFIPIGVIWPTVYKKLNTHAKVIAAGIGFSLSIELLQLPFFDRVSDIDDLLLNSIGFLAGYGIYLLFKRMTKKKAE